MYENSFDEVQKHVLHIPSINFVYDLFTAELQTIELCYIIFEVKGQFSPSNVELNYFFSSSKLKNYKRKGEPRSYRFQFVWIFKFR